MNYGKQFLLYLALVPSPAMGMQQQDIDSNYIEKNSSLSIVEVKNFLRWTDLSRVTEKEKLTYLHRAAMAGAENWVNALIELGALIDARDIVGETALHKAAKRGYVDIVRRLVAAGANRQEENNKGKRPLDLVGKSIHMGRINKNLSNFDATRTFLQNTLVAHTAQSAPQPSSSTQQPSYTPAQSAPTTLIDAANRGDTQAFENLLRAGQDPYATDSRGLNAIDHALLANKWPILKNAFKQGRQPYIDQRKNAYPQLGPKGPIAPKSTAEWAEEQAKQRIEIDKFLYPRAGRPKTIQALSRALSHNLTDLAQQAIDLGIPLENADKDGKTFLIQAAQHGETAIVHRLLTMGADPNAQAHNEVNLATDHGGKGRTALQWTLRMTKGAVQKSGDYHYHSEAITIDIIDALMAAGADPYVKDCPWQLTALDWAINNNQDAALDAIIAGRKNQLCVGPRIPARATKSCTESSTGQKLTKQLQHKKAIRRIMAKA